MKVSFLSILPFFNLRKNSYRTAALIAIAGFLAFSIFLGQALIKGLNEGLSNLSQRLGADIIVIPYAESTKHSLEGILLQGKPGYFYMNRIKADEVALLDGIEKVTTQFYLATLTAGCCSASVQIIGFDPKTDFVIKPWLKESLISDLNDNEVIVGDSLFAQKGDTLRFYSKEVKVAGRLAKTGTELDSAVYANQSTVSKLMEASVKLGRNRYVVNPDSVISSIFIKVKDGFDPETVAGLINTKVKKVKAVKTKEMISNLSYSIESISQAVGFLSVLVWLLSFILLFITFSMVINERRREFAVLRVTGARGTDIARIILSESVIVSLCGAVLGSLASCVVISSFATLIEKMIEGPFMELGFTSFLKYFFETLMICLACGLLTSTWSVVRILKTSPSEVLRDIQ
ncbi:MAG: ABC transporter permease [Succinivibrio sp.]